MRKAYRWFAGMEPFWHRSLLSAMAALLIVLIALVCSFCPSPILLLAIVLAVGVVIWAIRRPIVALMLVFIGTGLPSLLLPIPGHAMRPLEPALLLCLCVVLLYRLPLHLRLSHLLMLLFLAIALISFIHVPVITTTLTAYGADKRLYTLVLMGLALFCGTWLACAIRSLSAFLSGVLLANIPLYLIMLAQTLGILLPSLLENPSAQDPMQTLGRLWGPFDGAVTLGLYLTNLFALALSCWLLGVRRRERFIGAVMMLATGLGIVASGTRNAALAALFMFLLALLITRRFKLLLIMVVLMIMPVLLAPSNLLARFMHDASSTSNRLFLWQIALKLIQTHFWIGIGLQQFPTYYAQLIVSQANMLNPEGISVHNQYLELAMESGISWLVVGVLLLLSLVAVCWRAYRKAGSELRVLLLATLLALFATLFTGFFDVPLDKTEECIFLFLLAGLVLGQVEHQRQPSPRLRPQVAHRVLSTDSHSSGQQTVMPVANTRRTGRSILTQLLSWGVAVPLLLPATALLARYLGPVRYGEYSMVMPFLAVFALLTGTGMDPLIVRRLSRSPRHHWGNILGETVGTRFLCTLCSFLCALLCIYVLPLPGEQRMLLLMGSSSLFFSYSFNGLRTIYEHGFRAEEYIWPVSLLETLNRIATALLIFGAVWLHFSLLSVYALLLYSDIPFCLTLMMLARRRFRLRVRFDPASMYALLRASLPLSGYNIMTLLSGQADMLLLVLLSDAHHVGLYALASRITDPLLAVALAYTGGLYPLFCKQVSEGKQFFATVYYEGVRIMALVLLPLALLISAKAELIVLLLGGEQFRAAALLVQLLVWTMLATFFCQFAVRASMAVNVERSIPVVTAISAAANLLLNLLLIPLWQGVGAGIAALLSECIGCVLFMILLRPFVSSTRTLSILIRVMVGNSAALVLLLWQPLLPWFFVVPLTVLCSLCGYLLVRVLTWQELRFIAYSILKRRVFRQTTTPQGTLAWSATWDIAERPTAVLPRIQMRMQV